MGDWIQRKSGSKPVHQTTFDTSGYAPAFEHGLAVLNADCPRNTLETPAAMTSSGLSRISGAPYPGALFLIFRPGLVSTVSTLLKTHQTPRLPRPSGTRLVSRPESGTHK